MSKHKITLTDIINYHKEMEYPELYIYIMNKINIGELVPVKSSGTNGKKPALPNTYWTNEQEKDYGNIIEELTYQINPSIDTSYYLEHPKLYEKDKKYIRLLSDYITNNKRLLDMPETLNERSFEIFQEEKFLLKSGSSLMKRLGVTKDMLNYYETSMPLSYYSHKKETPQNFLILENKDTFYSMRKHLIEKNDCLMGLRIGTLVYGNGKTIISSFIDYADGAEPYFNHTKNKVYYFGDLDYEGIIIYEGLQNIYSKYKNAIQIELFTNAYIKMVDKAEHIGFNQLPTTKEKQNRNIGTIFMEYFDNVYQRKIINILEQNRYIPQEIINAYDY